MKKPPIFHADSYRLAICGCGQHIHMRLLDGKGIERARAKFGVDHAPTLAKWFTEAADCSQPKAGPN